MTTEAPETSTALVVPGSGTAVDLKKDPPGYLASVADEIAQTRGELADVENEILTELVNRLDRRGTWTLRERAGDQEYEIKAPSPSAGTTTYDVAALEERLRQHVAEEDIDPPAADAALERTVTVTFKVPITADKLEAVEDSIKAAREITIGGVVVEVASTSTQRKVRDAGMTALAKIPATQETVEAVKVKLPTPSRKAKVTPKRKER